jgi:hypothetical protein
VRLGRALPAVERAVLATAVALFAASAVLSPQVARHDHWTHFVHARAALADPVLLLDLWDRPGFTLAYAAPAALGLVAARLASVGIAALALAATMRAAAAFGLPRPWIAGVLVAAQYDFFGQASSTMTELPFAAALAVAAWGWAEDRPWLAAAGLGWLGITRPEGPLLAAIGAAALLVRSRRVGPAAAALAPCAAYLAVGAVAFGDPLWWTRGNPYRGVVSPRLELAQLARSFFFVALRRGQPSVLIVLEAAGAALAVAGPARRLRVLLAPVALSFLVLTFLRIGETDDWRESRYLVAIAPALALLAAAALEEALARFPRLAPPALLALAATTAAGRLTWNWRVHLADVALARPAVLAGALVVAAILWRARPYVPARAALALLLALPLAVSPPGAFGNHRPEGTPPAALITAPADVARPAPAAGTARAAPRPTDPPAPPRGAGRAPPRREHRP